MNRKGTVICLSFVLVVSFFVIIVEIAPVVKAPTTWYVDDVPGSGGPGDPPENFTSIQDAINASIDGDTVFVYNGTYYENVNVNKTINLTGEDRNSTIIDGGGFDDVVIVNRPWVNVSGFTTKNGGGGDFTFPGAGIKLGAYSTIFNNNICLNNNSGIVIFGTWNNITNNNISNNDVYAPFFCLS
jgi:hypothetical protein